MRRSQSPSAEFIKAVQYKTARASVGASAMRNQGEGATPKARAFLSEMPLKPFATSDVRRFRRQLDSATIRFKRALPRKARSWGLARKLLNIFLRDAFYNDYLRDRYRLHRAEASLEVPLDSIVAKKLHENACRRELPRWRGVKHLTPDVSDILQAKAASVAQGKRFARVHLDTFWYGMRLPEEKKKAGRRTAARRAQG